jgi:heme-degrading monooxygenase HmoA
MIRMTLHIRVKDGRAGEFERAWKHVAERVRSYPGNLGQALLRGTREQEFVITSDWTSEEAFHEFERSPAQDEFTAGLREMRESARMTTEQLLVHVERMHADENTRNGIRENQAR